MRPLLLVLALCSVCGGLTRQPQPAGPLVLRARERLRLRGGETSLFADNSALPQKVKAALPKAADTMLAAIGAGLGLAVLAVAQDKFKVTLYAPPMAATAVLLFAGAAPPPAVNVIAGTAGAAACGVAALKLFGSSLPVRCCSVAATLVWFKYSATFFPPATALAVLMVDNAANAAKGWRYVAFPCVAGNAILYLGAVLVAIPRSKARAYLTKQQWGMQGWSSERLKEARAPAACRQHRRPCCVRRPAPRLSARARSPPSPPPQVFKRYDTDGSGYLDADELRLALRSAGVDAAPADCKQLIKDTDTDGDGTIDFKEFKTIFQSKSAVRQD